MLNSPLAHDAALAKRLSNAFGRHSDPIDLVAARTREILGERAIVWEGDATTFQFSFVSDSSEAVLGYPVEDWLQPGFWADTVVHPEDRHDAVAFCAVATGQRRDHDFQYRARAADGRIVHLYDVVRVLTGARGVAERLRGIMIEVPATEDGAA